MYQKAIEILFNDFLLQNLKLSTIKKAPEKALHV